MTIVGMHSSGVDFNLMGSLDNVLSDDLGQPVVQSYVEGKLVTLKKTIGKEPNESSYLKGALIPKRKNIPIKEATF